MDNLHSVYNGIEIGIWVVFGVGFLIAAFRQAGSARTRCCIASFTFLLFGASDAIELHTGAWWKPWWLLAWKAWCVLTLLGLYVEHVTSRVRRKAKATGKGER